MMIDKRIWDDQAEFNRTLRRDPTTHEEKVALTKEFALHLVSEVTEMLDACGTWAMHRKQSNGDTFNEENFRRQLIDIQKYWISIAQTWGMPPFQLERTYWRKSATVRQRWSEEHLLQMGNRIAIVDFDNVLTDYSKGFCTWLQNTMVMTAPEHDLLVRRMYDRLPELERTRVWLSADSLGIPLAVFNRLQHRFRSGGYFAELPAMPGAHTLIHQLQNDGYNVVGLTSRPIDEYPNIFDDTLAWLEKETITLDAIWWGSNKAEKLAAMLPELGHVALVIDDDLKFIRQYETHTNIGRIYWLASNAVTAPPGLATDRVIVARHLSDIVTHLLKETV